MLVVVDSKKFEKLMTEVVELQRYEDVAVDYSGGVRDGVNETVETVAEKLRLFWEEVTG